MCRTSNFSYAPIDAGALGINTSAIVGDLTSSLNVKSQSNNGFNTTVQNTAKSHSNNGTRKSKHPHITVVHHYTDHSTESESIDDRPARGGVTTPFPIRLHKLLDKFAEDGLEDVVGWQPHGRCFVVRKPKEFKELLPVYFKLSKMSSFQRQLNLYGFQRLTRGRDKNGYYHEYFLRGKPSLSHKIQRTKVKGTGVRARSNPSTEPHLWEMSWVGTDASSAQQQHHHNDAGSVSSHEDHTASPMQSPAYAPKKMPQLISSSGFGVPPLSSSSTLVSPAPLWSQPFVQHQPELQQVQQPLCKSSLEQDIIMSFGGKQFHYLDPEEMMKEAQLRKKQHDACKKNDMQAFMSNLELDNLYGQLDDEAVDNDDEFMNMLERVIE